MDAQRITICDGNCRAIINGHTDADNQSYSVSVDVVHSHAITDVYADGRRKYIANAIRAALNDSDAAT